MTDHGSISLDSNFYFKFIVAWTCYSSISWWLLVASNQGRFLKLQVLLHFSKTFLSFLSGFLEFPTFTPNFLIGSQLRTIFYLIFTWSARSQDSTGMCVFILRIVVCVNISKTSSPCMLPATCPYIGCMWTHCRRPFAAQAAIDPIRNPPINEDLAMREAQRQQAIHVYSNWSQTD